MQPVYSNQRTYKSRSTPFFAGFVVVAVLLLLGGELAQAQRAQRLVLETGTMAELTGLLSAGDALHYALTKQDDEQIEVALRDIEIATQRTMAAANRLRLHERSHLVRILESIEENVDVARNSGHGDRRDRISDIFNMQANLVRIYGVDTRFKIFFCSRDKVTWVQTRPRGQYPFLDHGERDCAIRAH
ncbi:MAG: hypothetical protein RBT63_04715 [Bdellovibrionales bacterium]|jgi:exonuclease I|nr:hypothetical protein [Bdellovibrionales bacterium]